MVLRTRPSQDLAALRAFLTASVTGSMTDAVPGPGISAQVIPRPSARSCEMPARGCLPPLRLTEAA